MLEKQNSDEEVARKPRNKANMDQPQEEFIAADSGHVDEDERSVQPLPISPTGPSSAKSE